MNLSTTLQKRKPIKSKKVRDSARGEACTLNIVGCCNNDTETTVLAHLPDDSGCGKMGGKSDDLCAVYACSSCHDVLDGRAEIGWLDSIDNYELRALKRTIRRMYEKGVIKL